MRRRRERRQFRRRSPAGPQSRRAAARAALPRDLGQAQRDARRGCRVRGDRPYQARPLRGRHGGARALRPRRRRARACASSCWARTPPAPSCPGSARRWSAPRFAPRTAPPIRASSARPSRRLARRLGADVREHAPATAADTRWRALRDPHRGADGRRAASSSTPPESGAGKVAAWFGEDVPLGPVVPNMLVTEPLPVFVTRSVGVCGGDVYVRQVSRGNVIMGGGRGWGDAEPPMSRPDDRPVAHGHGEDARPRSGAERRAHHPDLGRHRRPDAGSHPGHRLLGDHAESRPRLRLLGARLPARARGRRDHRGADRGGPLCFADRALRDHPLRGCERPRRPPLRASSIEHARSRLAAAYEALPMAPGRSEAEHRPQDHAGKEPQDEAHIFSPPQRRSALAPLRCAGADDAQCRHVGGRREPARSAPRHDHAGQAADRVGVQRPRALQAGLGEPRGARARPRRALGELARQDRPGPSTCARASSSTATTAS